MAESSSGSFAEFYSVHFSRIAEELAAHLGDHAEAIAVTQEAFCRALDRWQRISREHQPEVWVRKTAWGLANGRLRYLWAEMPRLPAPDLPSVAIQPPGVAAAVTRVHRRRLARRSLLAAGMAATLVVPFLLGQAVRRNTGPGAPVLPTSPPSHALETRRVVVPGLELDVAPQVYFLDGNHGWAWFEACPPDAHTNEHVIVPTDDLRAGRLDDIAGTCRYGLAVTGNGGRTWRNVTLPKPDSARPDAAQAPPVTFFPHGPELASLHVGDEAFVTTDGGVTFTPYPPGKTPAQVLLAQLGRYQMLCLDDARCERTHLVKVGVGRMSAQPPLRGPSAYLINGADGRLWLFDYDLGSRTARLMVSYDEAKTWRELPFPEEADGQRPKLAPDGTEVWLRGQDSLLRLEGDTWVGHSHYGINDFTEWEPVGNGAVAAANGAGTFGFVQNGRFTPVAGVAADYLVVLGDGTLSLYGHMGLILGLGTGVERTWVRIL